MKRFFHLLCLFAVAALLPAALLVSRGLPADSHPYVERKYAGWNGVLRAWVCAQWECSGSFIRWLNACAADFEKQHDGVFIEFTPVTADVLNRLGADGARPPELVLFSPGTLRDSSMLLPVSAPSDLRAALSAFGDGFAYPVAMGGYVWVCNQNLRNAAPVAGDAFAIPPDDGAHSFSAAALALLSGVPEASNQDGEMPPEAGLDLGLPTAADAAGAAASPDVAGDALDRFIAGELPAVALTQAELGRLARLRDAGRGPDWVCFASGKAAYTDQLLLLGHPLQGGSDAQERLSLAQEFGAELLSVDAQARLAEIGAFAVTGERIYPEFSAYAALDGLLNSRELLTPASPWIAPADCSELLRALMRGDIDSEHALAGLWNRLRSSAEGG